MNISISNFPTSMNESQNSIHQSIENTNDAAYQSMLISKTSNLEVSPIENEEITDSEIQSQKSLLILSKINYENKIKERREQIKEFYTTNIIIGMFILLFIFVVMEILTSDSQ